MYLLQSVPIYVSEMAPYKYRGALNIMFQMSITIGILVANLLNYFFAKIPGGWGWRLSLGGAFVPALIILVGSFFLSETPNSLIEREKYDEAKEFLLKIRGVDNVDEEFNDLVAASEASRKVKHPWANITKRQYRPQLTMAIFIPLFQQLTGMNVFVFYAPVLFKTMGFGANASLMSALITSIVNMVATLVSIFSVDKYGRRTLFLEGGIQMFICQVNLHNQSEKKLFFQSGQSSNLAFCLKFLQMVMTVAIAVKFGTTGNPGVLPQWYATLVVVAMCIYIAGFAWSWGPLGWLVPSEIFPLEIRSAAQSINVSVNMLLTFVVAQVFTAMLCHMKFGLFIFFSVWVVIMTIFIHKLLPETKGVPIEEMNIVWQKHPFWRKYVKPAEDRDECEMGGKTPSV